MASPRSHLVPTWQQCMSLTDQQCRRIQALRDPNGIRANSTWEERHQDKLIRLYMTMMSFNQIETAMQPDVNRSYKTFQNYFRHWMFPLDRSEREQAVIELYNAVAGSNNPSPTPPPVQHPRPIPPSLPIRQSQPPQFQQQMTPQVLQQNNDFYPVMRPRELSTTNPHDRISTMTSASASSASSLYDETSNPRDSIFSDVSAVTLNSSMSSGSKYNMQPRPPMVAVNTFFMNSGNQFPIPPGSQMNSPAAISPSNQYHIPPRTLERIQPAPQQTPVPMQPRPMKAPKHDHKAGTWNGILNTVPCPTDHSKWKNFERFAPCTGCGFNALHALMLNARSISLGAFIDGMQRLDDLPRADFAGNGPLHFLAQSGVDMEHFSARPSWGDMTNQNSFGQNPVHVLNPQGLSDDELLSLLEWFQNRESPPGLLLTQRDIWARTPLHCLLQQPLPKSLYPRVIHAFPFFDHQLRSLNNSGKNIIKMMDKASQKIRSSSAADYAKLQAGITEVKLLLSEPSPYSNQQYGFHDIARGGRGNSNAAYAGIFYQCRICNQTNAHENSYLEQIECAIHAGRDRNAPDETGMTPPHAFLIHIRPAESHLESRSTETVSLFRVLLHAREALHVLDPEGNNLVYNASIRGYDEVLAYILSLETPERRVSMVNAVNKHGKSVLEATKDKIQSVLSEIQAAGIMGKKRRRDQLIADVKKLDACKQLLLKHRAELKPSAETRWRIVF
ncbi:uncharacterized protein PAC_17411 [Phialocephala subalpina]|uniref:Uncharacterized protein n=1 Tax=Phialocephala subalpina TaxID=576137 RepID=A0A1L7XR32_9HELO|nr:uncharacterized protein PAC_17411 [Phialocephala subalpina]